MYRQQALATTATVCAGVTSISVSSTAYTLFGGGPIGTLFGIGAFSLDIYKVTVFPSAYEYLANTNKKATGTLILASALTLASVSAWATQDFLSGSIFSQRNHVIAMQTQRVADLNEKIKRDNERITILDKSEADIRASVSNMRARGQATKAAEVEANELPKIGAERDIISKRIDEASVAITEIKSEVPKAYGLSEEIIRLIAVCFAIMLEIVPALVMITRKVSEIDDNFQPEEEYPAPPRRRQPVDDEELFRELLTVPSGKVVNLTEFAKTRNIGIKRAMGVMAIAVHRGILERGQNRSYVRTRLITVKAKKVAS